MDDISDTLSKLLGDPETLQQISRLKDLLMSDDGTENTEHKKQTDTVSGNSDTVSQLMKFLPVISDMNKDDDTTRLLKALKPFLSEERRSKLDEVTRILRLMKLLPVIRQIRF